MGALGQNSHNRNENRKVIQMKFNGVEIDKQSIEKARQWFIDNQQACIDGAVNGTLGLASHVDINEYVQSRINEQRSIQNGEWDNSFTFMQLAHYIQTGESVALLP
jgi:hypothetical protein